MNQGTVIFGVILFAFLVFITIKGQLPRYLGVLGLGQQQAPAKK